MSLLGKTIGNFRVIDLIGEGGMGEVYIGYDERLKRKVALKAIHSGKRFDEEFKTRLLREAEILSKLEHPNICRIYDFIETEDANLLVLELIKGTTLDKIDVSELSRSEKLRIAINLGEVLSDAHAHSVVHRDLKPENVMIDNRGEVKVLDFGLAYSIVDEKTATRIWTEFASGEYKPASAILEKELVDAFRTEDGVVLGTPMYMSPEQAHCKPATAASDMYSFGLLLQWLFTGKHPYPPHISMLEIFVKAGTGDTVPPDGVEDDLRTLIERLKSVEPTGRPTALDTVERLRWIDEAPRRRTKKLAIGAIIGALAIGIVISGFGLFQAKKSERRERIARNRQEKMSEFLVDMWISPSPMEQGRDAKVIDVLAYGKEKVESEFGDDPLIKAELLNHLATTYRRLGEYEKAESILTELLEYCRDKLGPDNSRTIQVMVDLGIILSYDERFKEAETLYRDALSAGEKNLDADNELLIYAKAQLAENLINKAEFSEAKELLREILYAIKGNEELEHKFSTEAHIDLGNILVHEEDFPNAEKIFHALLKDYEKMGDTDNPNYIAAMGSLARVLMEQKKHEEGLRYMREGLELSTRINGERHRNTLVMMINLGAALAELGKYEEALTYTERGYSAFREVFGERAPSTVFVSMIYSDLLIKLDRIDEAEPVLKEAISINNELLGPDHPSTIQSQYVMALLLFESGRDAEAESLVRNTLESGIEAMGADKDVILESKDLLGRILNRNGDHEEAERIHREVLESRISTLGGDNPSVSSTKTYLAESLYGQGKYDEACQLAEQAVRSNYRSLGGDHPSTKEAAALMVKVFTAAGKPGQADDILESLKQGE
jgi:non-specific serine/threonine protein kinase/serine/threonine-protein kinase